VVFVGSTQAKDNNSIPLPAAAQGIIRKGVKVIPVGMGSSFDPEELKAIASDSRAVFPQDAVDPLKRAVKKAASPSPTDGGFPGKILVTPKSAQLQMGFQIAYANYWKLMTIS